MGKGRAVLAALMLFAGGAARAAEAGSVRLDRPPAEIIASHAIWGTLGGAAVSGAVIGYEMGLQHHSDFPWSPVLLGGAGAGLLAGVIWGIVDATAGPKPNPYLGPVRDGASYRDRRPFDRSGVVIAPLAAGRF